MRLRIKFQVWWHRALWHRLFGHPVAARCGPAWSGEHKGHWLCAKGIGGCERWYKAKTRHFEEQRTYYATLASGRKP